MSQMLEVFRTDTGRRQVDCRYISRREPASTRRVSNVLQPARMELDERRLELKPLGDDELSESAAKSINQE